MTIPVDMKDVERVTSGYESVYLFLVIGQLMYANLYVPKWKVILLLSRIMIRCNF